VCLAILSVFLFKERRHLKMRLMIEQPFSVIGGVKLAGALFVCVLFFQLISEFLPSYLAPASLLGGAVSSAYTIISLGLLSLTVDAKTLLISAVAAMIGSYSVSAGVAKLCGKKKFGDSVLLQTGLLILASVVYVVAVFLFF
jgi:uncharacterized membrane protein (DUF4010 family)